MAVNIRIVDTTQRQSRERHALEDHMIPKLTNYFENKPEVSGDIIFYLNNLFMLSPTKEVDILMVGEFDNFQYECDEFGTVQIDRFCTVIEAKSHDIRGITFEGQTVKVDYPESSGHDALNQLKKEMDLMVGQLKNAGCGAYLTSMLWLHGVKKAEIKDKKPFASNIITKDLNFDDIIYIMLKQSNIREGYLNCAKRNGHFLEDIRRFFEEKKKGTSIQTIKSLNLFAPSKGKELYNEIFNSNDTPSILQGRAGTGKTISLLQLATYMAGEKMKKCLFLTYNTALVSDIRRILSYASYIHRQGIVVMSMEKYFRDIMKQHELWDEHQDGYRESFNQSLNKALKYLKNNNVESGYDFVFIDEAHDWHESDKEFLLALFDRERIIVADGIDQFIRSGKRLNWGDRAKELTVSMRQKSNIVAFVNAFSEKFKLGWNVAEGDLCGGVVEIHKGIDSQKISSWLKEIKESYGTGYDLLMLVPPEMTEETTANGRSDHRFSLIDKYAEKGIKIFDGTCKKLRDEGYPDTEYDMLRLYEYASCRGLEGWITVCLRFDKYIESRLRKGDDNSRIQEVILESLIPLTRAVDTLIITLSDPDSPIGKTLKQITVENPGAAFWKI